MMDTGKPYCGGTDSFPKFEGEARPVVTEAAYREFRYLYNEMQNEIIFLDMKQHKADQRSRDRLMLAGQIAAALLSNPAPWDKELNTVELRMAHVFRNVDALLSEHERTKETTSE